MRARAKAFCASFRLARRAPSIVLRLHSAVWLRVLDIEDLEAITIASYLDSSGSGFESEEHNLDNIWPWEEAYFRDVIADRRRVLVAAAGGGREMIALALTGHVVIGFDATPDLVAACRRNLEKAGVQATMIAANPTEVPALEGSFDALVLGRGFYHHIPSRKRRVAFLQSCRAVLEAGSPVYVGDILLRRDGSGPTPSDGESPSAPGNYIGDSFFHFFTRQELLDEFALAGFSEVAVEDMDLPGASCMVHVLARNPAMPGQSSSR